MAGQKKTQGSTAVKMWQQTWEGNVCEFEKKPLLPLLKLYANIEYYFEK